MELFSFSYRSLNLVFADCCCIGQVLIERNHPPTVSGQCRLSRDEMIAVVPDGQRYQHCGVLSRLLKAFSEQVDRLSCVLRGEIAGQNAAQASAGPCRRIDQPKIVRPAVSTQMMKEDFFLMPASGHDRQLAVGGGKRRKAADGETVDNLNLAAC